MTKPELQDARGIWSRMSMMCRGRCGERGDALVELALALSILGLPLLVGTADMGFVVYDSIEVANAAHAAALYGMQSSTYAANTSGMTAAAQTEASDFGTALTVTPTPYYACSNAIGGTQYTGSSAQSNATAACTGGTNHALEFVQVNTSATVTPPIHLPGLAHTFTVTGSSVMEVEQ
jgi:Flp pilus assembly protein TadG